MAKISIAQRIKRAMIGLSLVLCLVFMVLTMLMVYVVEDQVFINLLKNEQHQLEQLAVDQRDDWQPSNQYMQWYLNEQQVPAEILSVTDSALGVYEYFDDGQAGFVLRGRFPDEGGDYLISFDVSGLLAVRSSRLDLWILIATVSLLLMMVSVWLAYRLANRSLSPIKQLTAQLQDEHQDLPQGFAADFSGDEVGILAQQLAHAIDRANQAAQREFEFNRGISHELRTPIQIAQNSLELMSLDHQRGTEHTPAMRRLERAITDMHKITEAFLWLAHGKLKDNQTVDVEAVIVALKHRYQNDYPDRAITFTHDPMLKYVVPPSVLWVMLDNLLRNAMQHSHDGDVVCEFNKQYISIENMKDQLSGHSGYGLGLAIIERLCEHLHWRLEVVKALKDRHKVMIHVTV